jgi:ABC-2 type transport system permease protein
VSTVHLYFRYLGVTFRGKMQYRLSFAMMTFGTFVITAGEMFGIWVMFARFGTLRGWTLPEVAFLYGGVNMAIALGEMIFRGFDLFSTMVRQGDFDRVLLRPVSTVLQVAGQDLSLQHLGRFAQGLIALLWAAGGLGIAWTPAKVILTVGGIGSGICIFAGLFVLQATMCFWTVESMELMNILTYGGTETAQYPLAIYRPWVRRLFTWIVPLACIGYLPSAAIFAKSGAAAPLLSWISPLGGVVFFAVCLRVWNFGVRHYCSTGS